MNQTETVNHFSWTIGGPQGTGVDSSANLFLSACAAAGLNCYGKREYHSTIKTGHSYTQIRVSETPINSHVDPVHLLTSFEKSAPVIHAHEIVAGGALIYDPQVTNPDELDLHPDVLRVAVPFDELLTKLAEELDLPAAKAMIMKNTLAVGASLALTNFDPQYIEEALKGIFSGRKAKLVAPNMKAVECGYQFIKNLGVAEKFAYRLEARPEKPAQLVLNGTTAVALGKLKAGCRFQTYYPITPASDESVFLEAKASEYGINVVQAEDEIASACMAVGGSLTGVRAATSTSCPGFGLMAEPIGWASINEVPVVVFNYQRGAPATGLPTRHEQGDLLSTRFISHGNPPRVVMAPSSLPEYFEFAFESFNIADEFQGPVLVLTDKCIGGNTQSIAPFNEDGLKIRRGKMVSEEELKRLSELPEYNGQFKRFKFSDDGISPRVALGEKHGIYWNTGDEHDEFGHIDEESENRQIMLAKREMKLETIAKMIPEHLQYTLHGPEDADLTVVTWGATLGPLLDAMPILKSDGITMNILVIKLFSPFPAEAVSRILSNAKTKVGFEANTTGQLAELVKMETGISMDHRVRKWNGRPTSETEAVQAIREIVSQKTKELVLTYGH